MDILLKITVIFMRNSGGLFGWYLGRLLVGKEVEYWRFCWREF
jgi:hypothetical protein